jgi:hypothetical protein
LQQQQQLAAALQGVELVMAVRAVVEVVVVEWGLQQEAHLLLLL